MRFAVLGKPVPMRATHAILLTDDAHRVAGRLLKKHDISPERRRDIMGTNGARSDHQHAHWLALPESPARGAAIGSLVVWVRDGLQQEELAAAT